MTQFSLTLNTVESIQDTQQNDETNFVNIEISHEIAAESISISLHS